MKNFPIKVGNDVDVINYSKKLVKGEEQLLITRDTKTLYLTDGKGGFIKITSSNLDKIDDLSKEFMKIKDFDKDNDGIVDNAKISESLKGEKQASPLTFYGKNNKGEIGFHYLPLDNFKESSSCKVEQRVKLNAKANTSFVLDVAKDKPNNDLFIQPYRHEKGSENIVQVLKDFDNTDELNFFYDKNNVELNGVMRIKDIHSIKTESINNIDGLFIKKGHISLDDYRSDIGLYGDSINIKNDEDKSLVPCLDSDLDKGFKCSCSSNYENYPAYQVFNDQQGKYAYWCAKENDVTGWIQVELPKQATLKGFDFYSAEMSDSGNASPRHWFLQGSNDGVNWSNIEEFNYDKMADSDGDCYKFNLKNNSDLFKFFRFDIKQNMGNPKYLAIKKIKLYGTYKSTRYVIKYNNEFKILNNDKEESFDLNSVKKKDFVKNLIGMNIEITNKFITKIKSENKIKEFEIITISNDDEGKALYIKGLKSNRELIMSSDNISKKIVNNIDFFNLEIKTLNNGKVKIVFSNDDATWFGFKGSDFEKIDGCNISSKKYESLSKEELANWDKSKDLIFDKGINPSDLKNIDFNKFKGNTIRFAYVIQRPALGDVAEIDKLSWQFDAKGSMIKMKDNEYDTELLDNSIKFTPKIDNELIKINVLTNGDKEDSKTEEKPKETGWMKFEI